MKSFFYSILLFVIFINSADAHSNCSRNAGKAMHKTTIATIEEDYYDIKGLKFDIALSNTSTAVSGNVITYATTNISNFSIYAFELDNNLTVDSVKVNNELLTVTTNGAVRKATLSTPLAVNTPFTAQVFYHGQTPAGVGQFFTGGLNLVSLPTGTKLMYSLSDPWFTDDWWPCKQSLLDKIDSVAMWVTVDDTLKVGSNGLLQQVTPMGGNRHRYEWKTNYPIDYYLIAVAVAPYKEYNYYMHFTDGSGDSMLVQNFIYDSATVMTPVAKAIIDSTGYMIDHFSKIYSRYPFDDEKYGHCMTRLSGGMEHQTMTFMSTQNLSTTLVAHELGHQWWGNNVTYGKWEDLWLSEGMATYTEQLYLEHFWGTDAAKDTRSSVFSHVMTSVTGSVWIDDTTSVNRIFDGRLTYNKGAAVAHMLRYMAPEDSLFFKGLRNFQQQYKYGSAVTADLQAVMEQVYNIDLDSFFSQWIYGQGYPIYTARWEQSNNLVHIRLVQKGANNITPMFNIPVQVKLSSASGDTIVQIPMNDTAEHYVTSWDKTVTGITIDPDDHIVNRTGAISRDPSLLSVYNATVNNIKIYPNPATNGWNIMNTTPGTTLQLYDLNGKLLYNKTTNGNTFISTDALPKGCYLLKVQEHGRASTYHKLLK